MKKEKQKNLLGKQKKIFSSYLNYFHKDKKFFLIGVLILIGLFLLYKTIFDNRKNKLKTELLPKAIKKILQNEKANFSIDYLKETSGVYEFQLTLKDQNNKKYISYLTKDGKILFVSGIKLDDLFRNKQISSNEQRKTLTCSDLKKSTQPELTAYVMADCPFGLQMQRVFKNVINVNKEAEKNLRVEYIFSQDSDFNSGNLNALHGKEEAKENLKQICIREEQPNLYWPYVSCYMKKANNSENCLNEIGVNKTSLNQCMSDKNRGLKYAKKDFDNTQRLGVAGSPTLVLNGEQVVSESDFGGRTPSAIKEILCCSADKKLTFCSQEFSKNEVAISFSQSDEKTAGTSTASVGCQ